MPNRTLSALHREQQRSPKAPVLPSAVITSPRPTAPVRSLPIQVMPSLLSKESSREGSRPPCCCLQLFPRRTLPCRAAPHRNSPERALSAFQGEQQRAPKCSVLPPATVALPNRNLPYFAMPDLAGASLIYSPKRAAEGSELPSAAVCSYSPAAHDRVRPNATVLHPAQSYLSVPSWDLYQRMPSMIKLLFQRASGSDFQ